MSVLRRIGIAGALVVVIGCGPDPSTLEQSVIGATVPELRDAIASGSLSAETVTRIYLQRIARLDDDGPMLGAILEINPEAIALARDLDATFAIRGPVGPLHGIPVVLKANIDTGDRMATSAGSIALAEHRAPDDADLVRRLRAAGAVVLAKANLSEWANFRSSNSVSGWSSLGGQTRNPYVLDRNPCGSSSGSAVAVAARLAPLAIGTETDGSIVCPAAANGVVGVKPTLGIVAQDGIVPIAASQDTAGPMARTVAGTALALAAMATSASTQISLPTGDATLRGLRIGVVRDYRGAGRNSQVEAAFAASLAAMEESGAVLVDPITLEIGAEERNAEFEVLLFEFHDGIERYLRQSGAALSTLEELIDYNRDHADRVMPYFGQDIFESAARHGDLDDPAYARALQDSGDRMRQRLTAAFDAHALEALIAPSNGPAWETDLAAGDRFEIGSASLAAVSGFPSVTVPAQLTDDLPLGITLIGRPYSENRLLQIAAAFETQRGPFPPPSFLATRAAAPR